MKNCSFSIFSDEYMSATRVGQELGLGIGLGIRVRAGARHCDLLT